MSRWSCISVGYLGGHVLVCDIEVIIYLCRISRWTCIGVGYLGGHVLVWYVEVIMY
jgi:hypothetical protein